MKKLVLSILTTLTITIGYTQTYVNGGIYTNTTWTTAGNPYIVNGHLTLFPGYTLTIEPGVKIKVNNGIKIAIRGDLQAIGTISDSILFTSNSSSPAQSSWDMINIETHLGGQATFDYCIIKYAEHGIDAGWGFGGNGPVSISNTHFDNNWIATYGYFNSNWNFESCYFTNNNIGIMSPGSIVSNSTFINNQAGITDVTGVDIYNSIFCGNEKAIRAGQGELQNNLIAFNNIGVDCYYGDLNINNNTIIYNNYGVKVLNSIGTGNSICRNYTYNIENVTANPIDAENNCWCDTNTSVISQSIYDGYDNISLGLVDFTPFVYCDITAIPDISDCSDILTDNNTQIISDNKLTIIVFPNPTTGLITINNEKLEIKNVAAFDIYGKEVLMQDVTLRDSKCELNLSQQAKGIYIIKVTTDKGVAIEKLILN